MLAAMATTCLALPAVFQPWLPSQHSRCPPHPSHYHIPNMTSRLVSMIALTGVWLLLDDAAKHLGDALVSEREFKRSSALDVSREIQSMDLLKTNILSRGAWWDACNLLPFLLKWHAQYTARSSPIFFCKRKNAARVPICRPQTPRPAPRCSSNPCPLFWLAYLFVSLLPTCSHHIFKMTFRRALNLWSSWENMDPFGGDNGER